MRHLRFIPTWSFLVILFGVAVLPSFAAQPGTLSVGAARVDITPDAEAALTMSGYDKRKQGFRSIHDHIYVRAIVLNDGKNSAAILSWELVGMPTAVWANLSQRISKELEIPADNLILAGEHVHSAPSVGAYENPSPKTIAYITKLENEALEAVRQARRTFSRPSSASEPGKLT